MGELTHPTNQEAGAPDAADQIKKLAELRDQGVLTTEEFEQKKKALLGIDAPGAPKSTAQRLGEQAKEHLDEDESILAGILGSFSDGKSARNGILFATARKVAFYAEGAPKIEAFEFPEIRSVALKSRNPRTVALSTSNGRLEMTEISEGDPARFVESVKKKIPRVSVLNAILFVLFALFWWGVDERWPAPALPLVIDAILVLLALAVLVEPMRRKLPVRIRMSRPLKTLCIASLAVFGVSAFDVGSAVLDRVRAEAEQRKREARAEQEREETQAEHRRAIETNLAKAQTLISSGDLDGASSEIASTRTTLGQLDNPTDVEKQIDDLAREVTRARVRSAARNLADEKEEDGIVRAARRLSSVVAGHPEAVPPSIRALASSCDEVTALQTRIEGLIPTAPVKPEKPVYQKPVYTGAVPLRGPLRGDYENEGFLGIGAERGVVVNSGGRLKVVVGAERASFLTVRFNGYVIPKNKTVTLNIGRTGREAEVFEYSDRETYLDDQRMYREQVKNAKQAHADALKRYQAAMADYKKASAQYAADRETLRLEREALERKRQEIISSLPSEAARALAASE